MVRLIGCLFLVAMFSSCAAQKNDIDCVREINKLVLVELTRQSSGLDTNEIQLILALYLPETNTQLDSVVVLKSNLIEKGLDQNEVLKLLREMDSSCLSQVYAKGELNPDYVTYRFNP